MMLEFSIRDSTRLGIEEKLIHIVAGVLLADRKINRV